MKDTVKALLESSARPEHDFITENTINYNKTLEVATEAEIGATKYTAQKVIVTRTTDDKYVIEYSNNLERFMLDSDIGITEAMFIVADINNIPIDECTVVFDEQSIASIDFKDLAEIEKHFRTVRV